MNEKAQYFRIGLFTFAAIGIFAFALIIFGAGDVLKKETVVETYFNRSVQGLDVGSAVKYRGVTVGQVKEVSLVKDKYQSKLDDEKMLKYGGYVRVVFTMSPELFPRLTAKNAQGFLDNVAEDEGLCVKMGFIGITGLAYLEIDFILDSALKPLDVGWKPRNLYIPSRVNTFARLDVYLNKMLDVMDTGLMPMIQNISAASEDFPELTQNLNETLKQTQLTLQNVNDVLNRSKPVVDNINEITASAKKNPSQFVFGSAPPKSKFDR